MNIYAVLHKLLLRAGIKVPLSKVNKFSVTFTVFVTWLLFFDSYSLIVQYKLRKTVNYLEEEKVRYQDNLDQAIVDRETLRKDKEKFAREKYRMHKENEEVIIIED
jgi:cell division protein DivIC